MLRVFGACALEGVISKSIKDGMASAFIGGDKAAVSYVCWESKNIYLFYEHAQNKDAERFFYTDKINDQACFVIGNIHAYQDKAIHLTARSGLARWVLEKYRKERSLDFAKDLRGIFNVIVIDRGRVFLINDILGLSPMYLQQAGKTFFFCTEAEPIVEMGHDQEADLASIVDFFVYGLVPQGRTFFKGLHNQESGSIVSVSLRTVGIERYGIFQQARTAGLSPLKKTVLLKDAFREAVSLMTPGQQAYADLTGGLDTRFIIAHLMELKKEVTAITFHIDDEDVDCARRFARRYHLKHYVEKTKGDSAQDYVYKFQTRFGKDRHAGYANAALVRKRRQLGVPLCRYPKFGGQFANGLLSQPIVEFRKAMGLDHQETARKIFKPHVVSTMLKTGSMRSLFPSLDSGSNKGMLKSRVCQFAYVTQIGRSYVNVYHGKFWARPTQFFEYGKLMPFVDAKFLSVLLSLEDGFFLRYQAYYGIYQRFFPEFYKFPVAGRDVRKNDSGKTVTGRGYIEKMIAENVDDPADFKMFLKENGIVALNPFVLSQRLSGSIVFYHWCRSNKNVYEKLRSSINR